MNRNVWLVVGVALILTMALASGCGYLENKGTSRENIKPKVFITNVPLASVNEADTVWKVDTIIVDLDTTYDTLGVIAYITYDYNNVVSTVTYFANPRIHWFGTDEDGRVVAYEYAVIPTYELDPHPAGLVVVSQKVGDSIKVNPERFVDDPVWTDTLDWIYVETPEATVGLYADIDTNVAIDQFLFVRAIDDRGLHSDVKFARYSRRNHPPNSYIQLDTIEVIRILGAGDVVRDRKYYSLPQSTETYPGITIGWSGSDSIDYPDIQPPFDYNWTLYGPFDTKESATSDISKRVKTNDNLNTLQVEWTDQDRHTFFNLRSGWYLFEVRSRDDAFVADPTPAKVRFEVVEPSFDKPYLLMDASNYWEGSQVNAGAINFQGREPGTLPRLAPDTIHSYFYNLFANQGYEFSKLDVWTRVHLTDKNYGQYLLPDRDVLARYKAIIVVEFDIHSPLDKDVQGGPQFTPALSDYMNVGGRVVLIGRNLFGYYVPNWNTGASPPQEVQFSSADFAYKYFGVTRMYFPGHYLLTAADLPNYDGSKFTDFVGVLPLDPNFPTIEADTSTPFLSWIPPIGDEDPPDTVTLRGRPNMLTPIGLPGAKLWGLTPDVNWIGIDRARGANGFYQFSSSRPNTSPSQGRICGATFEYYDRILDRPTYRTAILTFELWTMEHSERARRLANQLLTYILE